MCASIRRGPRRPLTRRSAPPAGAHHGRVHHPGPPAHGRERQAPVHQEGQPRAQRSLARRGGGARTARPVYPCAPRGRPCGSFRCGRCGALVPQAEAALPGVRRGCDCMLANVSRGILAYCILANVSRGRHARSIRVGRPLPPRPHARFHGPTAWPSGPDTAAAAAAARAARAAPRATGAVGICGRRSH